MQILARRLGQTFVRNLSEKVPREGIGYNTETITDSNERPHNRSARPTSTVYQGGNTLQVLTTKCLSHVEDKTDIHAIVDSFWTRSQMEYRGVFSPSFLTKSTFPHCFFVYSGVAKPNMRHVSSSFALTPSVEGWRNLRTTLLGMNTGAQSAGPSSTGDECIASALIPGGGEGASSAGSRIVADVEPCGGGSLGDRLEDDADVRPGRVCG